MTLPTGVGAVRTFKRVVTLPTGVGAVRTCKRVAGTGGPATAPPGQEGPGDGCDGDAGSAVVLRRSRHWSGPGDGAWSVWGLSPGGMGAKGAKIRDAGNMWKRYSPHKMVQLAK